MKGFILIEEGFFRKPKDLKLNVSFILVGILILGSLPLRKGQYFLFGRRQIFCFFAVFLTQVGDLNTRYEKLYNFSGKNATLLINFEADVINYKLMNKLIIN